MTTMDVVTIPASAVLNLPGLKFEDGHLILPDDLTFDQWSRIVGFLRTIERNCQFWLADALNYGERKFGERYSQAIQAATGYQASTLANIAWVGRKVEPSRRRESLSFGHHAAVASLPAGEQDEMLDLAEQAHWSVGQLREQVKACSDIPVEPISGHQHVCATCGEVW